MDASCFQHVLDFDRADLRSLSGYYGVPSRYQPPLGASGVHVRLVLEVDLVFGQFPVQRKERVSQKGEKKGGQRVNS